MALLLYACLDMGLLVDVASFRCAPWHWVGGW